VRSLSELKGLPNHLDLDADKLRDARGIIAQTKAEEKVEDKFCDMYQWLKLLQKARRQHKRRPHIPTQIMRKLMSLKLAKPVRF